MNIEQNILNQETPKAVENNQPTAQVEVSKEDKEAEATIVQDRKAADDQRIEEIKKELGIESKENYPEGHILNPEMLDKIAQLEAIDPTTLEFNQDRYDDYINGQPGLGSYSVGVNQEKLKRKIDAGRKIKNYYDAEVIYGQGGWNRYPVHPDSGEVFLSRGSSNTSGSPEYKARLAQKAIELGLKVEGNN